ncbi:hypothetical protein JTE90_020857 [Oedothorax gibbosus]|uniref:Glycerate kinase n=1 Tax=Oedothorax gibbosus TaxID=931172 RepID=A0AAV6UQU2_9ARAC|nr:hypothetical protein JTE90_020857 [Oedothorax gibbosus]
MFNTSTGDKLCQEATEIFQSAYKAVLPSILMNKAVTVYENSIEIKGKIFPVDKNINVVGFGKAVLGMAAVLDHKFEGRNLSGILSIPKGSLNLYPYGHQLSSNIQIFEGAFNNIPDEDALYAATKIKDLVSSLTEEDMLIVLISGGGSALLPAPKPPLTLDEKKKLISLLFSKGATIEEINSVRKILSSMKGGNLAELAKPASVISLILSDIIGNSIGMIASGPTVQNTDDPKLPISIIEKYNLRDQMPKSASQFLENTLPTPHADFSHVTNFIIGNNQMALEAAAQTAQKIGFHPIVITNELKGTASHVGKNLISTVISGLEGNIEAFKQNFAQLDLESDTRQTLLDNLKNAQNHGRKLCLLFGGETTVEVRGNGIGGRNQELALAAAVELHAMKKKTNIVLLSAGTDGIDGPTPAAGAIAAALVVDFAKKEGLDPEMFLKNNDSYSFFSQVNEGRWLIQTGHTGTNVMDIIVILIN